MAALKHFGALAGGVALAACATAPAPVADPAPNAAAAPAPAAPQAEPARLRDPTRYTCDGGRVLHLRPTNDSLAVEGLGEARETLLRDAGGVGPQQSVWSSDRLRVELGLGDDARHAVVQVLQPQPMQLQCHGE